MPEIADGPITPLKQTSVGWPHKKTVLKFAGRRRMAGGAYGEQPSELPAPSDLVVKREGERRGE